ncbi:MAG: DUF2182 domain-containing protein [Pseudomonadota bacterium]
MTSMGSGRAAEGSSAAGISLPWLALYGFLALAWAGVWAMDGQRALPPELSGLGLETLRALCRAAAADASLPGLWAMWAVMGAAMMLPTALPAIRSFAMLNETIACRPGADDAFGAAFAVPALAAGFVAVWSVFALGAAALQAMLVSAGLMLPGGEAVGSEAVAAGLLLLAGIWQLSALKDACLSRCRSPMRVFLKHWGPGAGPAFGIGVRMGADCVGCCWALMLLALVGGTSNLLFMAGATVLMMLEKLPAIGGPITRPLGFALIAAAGWTATHAAFGA